jgi:diguanylate cyclase (GGDEF)-like protein
VQTKIKLPFPERAFLSPKLMPWLVLGIGLVVTYALQDVARQENHRNVQERFEFRANELVGNIAARLRSYEQVLKGAKGLFVSSRQVGRSEFREYVSQLDLSQRYPGIQGVGFSLRIAPGEMATHIKKIRSEGFPGYAVRPEGKRDTYTSIIFLEPFDWRNQRAFGFDMYSEPVRRAAMQRACDENLIITSGKVTLVQETEKDMQSGFLMYLPVYRAGQPHQTLAERRANLLGWVYAPFRMHDLMQGILGEYFGETEDTISFDIYDGDTPSRAGLMYDFDEQTGISAADHKPVFNATRHLDSGGRQWTVAVHSLPGFEVRLNSTNAKYISLVGGTISFLSAFIVWLLLTGRERAYARAREMTRELSASESHTRRLNRALKLLSACNVALVRADDEHRLLAEICQLIVGRGGYLMAWVGYAEQDAVRTVRPVAQAGFEEGYLDSVNISWADDERGRGPTGTAIRTGFTDVNQNYLGDPRMAPWREAALKRGYQSSIALPLHGSERVLGALCIYAAEPKAFIADEVELLEELAGDLAYGIETLRTRAEHRLAEEKLAYMAYHDALTQLPNRSLLQERFELVAREASQKQVRVGMLYLGLDNFKQVNDALGHSIGDRLLVRVVERLRDRLRDVDIVSRHGGDQFVVLVTDVQDPGVISATAQKIIDAFAEPVEVDENVINTTFSIGISVFPDDGSEFDMLLKKADTAMFSAKDHGRNNYQFFTEKMNSDALEQLQLHGLLLNALGNRELSIHYQAQVDIRNGSLVGFEALLRWQHPVLGMVSPARFIPVAEHSGLIIPVGEWVLNEACRQARVWLDEGHPLVMAVNLSVVQFRRGNLLEVVANALGKSGLPAHLLELELTESILLHDLDTAMNTLRELTKLGVKLSIDDFGTGYSSLAYLKRLHVNKLKIDQSFVRGLSTNSEDDAIVSAIIQLGHTLQLTVIAEGVETDAQLAFLKDYGCDEVQGYYFSRPVTAIQAAELFAKDFLQ